MKRLDRPRITSLLARLLAGWLAIGTPACAQTLTNVYQLDPATHYQTIDNFGANDAWSMQKIGAWSLPNKERIADLLFSTNQGIGLSCWRFNVGAGLNTHTIPDPWRTVETFEIAPGQYDWTRQANERWFLRAAKAHGVRQFLATFYSPPLRLTRNGLSNLGSDHISTTNLKPGAEDAYALYITDILRHFRDHPDPRERIEFAYVLPVNEPQWDWQHGQEGNRAANVDLLRIYTAVARHLQAAGLKTRILGPESGSLPDMAALDAPAREKWHADYGDYLHLICDHPAIAAGFGGVISYHSYWSDQIPDHLVPDRQQLGAAFAHYPGWKIWQSEYCVMEPGRDLTMATALRVARVIHYDLTLVNASAWQWWSAVAGEDFKSGLIFTDYRKPGDAATIYQSKLLWALGNYSRFIRPGMVRVELSGPQELSGLLGSACLDPATGHLVLVFVNESNDPKPLRLQSKSIPLAPRWYTPSLPSAQDNLTPGTKIDPTAGLTVPPRSLATLVSDPIPPWCPPTTNN